MTRYVEAFTWTGTIQKFLDEVVTERPLLNVCAGKTRWGDAVTMDRYEPADVHGTWTRLPFADNSFGAVFADPPWDAEYKTDVALFVREAVRLAPVAYLMAPWTYGASWLNLTRIWVRQMPGVNRTVSLTRYERRGDIPPPGGSAGWTGHSWNARERREARVRAVARRLGRPSIGIELSPESAAFAREKLERPQGAATVSHPSQRRLVEFEEATA